MIDKNLLQSLMDKMSQLEINGIKSNYIIGDRKVPRVTEIISSMLHDDNLMNWSNSLGWKRISYRAFMKEAADKGTFSHLAIEKYLKNGHFDISELKIPSNNYNLINTVISCMDGFFEWWKKIHETYKKIEVIYLEETLICDYFGGTCDCLLKVDDKYWLIDFKTSNNMNYSYVLQLSAYRFLLKKIKNIDIDVAMILKVSKTNHSFTTYEFDMVNDKKFLDDCFETFMLLAAAFKARIYTSNEFKMYFK